MLSATTIQLFETLLGAVQVKGNDPNFETTTATIIVARQELAEAKVALDEERDNAQP